MIEIKNTGRLVQGHVLDVKLKPFLRSLKDFDNRLYIKWNPKKNRSNGKWELWRLPKYKTPVFFTELNGKRIHTLEYRENMFENYIADVKFIDYSIISTLQKLDTAEIKDFNNYLDYADDKKYEKDLKRSKDDLAYNLKHHRKEFAYLYEDMRSGGNPLKFFMGTYKHFDK